MRRPRVAREHRPDRLLGQEHHHLLALLNRSGLRPGRPRSHARSPRVPSPGCTTLLLAIAVSRARGLDVDLGAGRYGRAAPSICSPSHPYDELGYVLPALHNKGAPHGAFLQLWDGARRGRATHPRWGPRMRGASVRRVRAERCVPVLEQVQVTLAMQLNDSLEILLATALVALGLLPEFAIGRLSVARSIRHLVAPFVVPRSASRRSL